MVDICILKRILMEEIFELTTLILKLNLILMVVLELDIVLQKVLVAQVMFEK